MFEGYLELGGGEVLNSARSLGYTRTAPCPVAWLQCPPCDGIRDVLNDDAYTYANIMQAPWYDVEDEVTHRFLGAHALTIEGIPDSTREASVTEGVQDGGVVGRVRHATRRMRVRAVLSAIGEDALEAGFSWLNSALTPGKCATHADACGASDTRFFTACPPERADITKPGAVWNDELTNLVTHPSFELPGAEVILAENLATNPSMETAGAAVVVRGNGMTNPAFRALGALTVQAENLVTNPSFETAGAPQVLLTNLATNPSFEAPIAPVEARRNLHYWPRLNTGSAVGHWAASEGGISATVTPTGLRVGGGNFYQNWLQSVTDDPWTTGKGAVLQGDTVTFSAEFQVEAGLPQLNVQINLQAWSATAQIGSEVVGTMVTVLPGTTVRINSAPLVLPQGADQVKVWVTVPGGGDNAYFIMRNTLLEKSATAKAYFDGSTTAAGDFTYGWTGTADASASVAHAPGVAGWQPGGVTGVGYQTVDTPTNRSKALRLVVTYAGQGPISLTANPPAGGPYTIMGKVRPRTRDQVLLAGIGGTRGGQFTAPKDVWTEFRFTASTGDAYPLDTGLYISTAGHQVGDVIDVDEVLLVAGTYTGPYFDGSTPVKARRNVAPNPTTAGPKGYFRAYDTEWTFAKNTPVPVPHPQGITVAGKATHHTGPGRQLMYLLGTDAAVGYTRWIGAWVLATAPGYRAAVWFDGGHPEVWTVLTPNVWTWIVTPEASASGRDWAVVERIDGAAAPATDAAYITGVTSLVEGPPTDSVWGDRAAAGGNAAAWEGTANDSPSYLYDPSYTYAWTGTPDASTSTQNVPGVADVPATGSATAMQVADAPVVGSKVLRWTVNSGDNVNLPLTVNPTVGNTYTILGKVRPRTRDTLIQPQIGGTRDLAFTAPKDVWTDFRATLLAGNGFADATGLFLLNSTGHRPGDIIDVDAVMLVAGTYYGNYFDGDTPDGGNIYDWTGVPHDSTSTLSAMSVPGNLRAEGKLSWQTSAGGAMATVIDDTGEGGRGLFMDLVAGQPYTILVRGRAVASNPELRWAGGFLSGPLDWTSEFADYRYQFTATAPTVFLENSAIMGTGVELASILVTEGNYSGAYFDGSTADAGGATYDWTGAPDASTSTQSALGVADVPNPVGARGWQTIDTPADGAKALRFELSTDSWAALPVTTASPPEGVTYTLVGKVRPRTRDQAFTPQIRGAHGAVFTAPKDVWTEFRTSVVAGTSSPVDTGLLLTPGAGHQVGDIVDIDAVVLVAGGYGGPYFDGYTLPDDPDITEVAWVGAPHASTSTVKAMGVENYVGDRVQVVHSTQWAADRGHSLRMVPTGAGMTDNYVSTITDPRTYLLPDTLYTLMVTVHVEAPLTGPLSSNSRGVFVHLNGTTQVQGQGPGQQAPNTPGDHQIRFTFTTPSSLAGYNTIRLYHGGEAGSGDLWWDRFMIVEGDYVGPYFDGASLDSTEEELETPGTNVRAFEWLGTPDASQSLGKTGSVISIPDEEGYVAAVNRLVRVMHTVTCVSGPIVEQKLHRGDTWGYIVEFVLVAAVPWMFGVTTPVALLPSTPIVVQDVPFNLVPYPSAEIASGTVVAATNLATNPSVELNANGWGVWWAGNIPEPLKSFEWTSELASVGSSSVRARLLGNSGANPGNTVVSDTTILSEGISLAGLPAGTRVSASVWAALLLSAGAAPGSTLRSVGASIHWLDGANQIISSVLLGWTNTPADFGGKVFSGKSHPPAAGAVAMRVAITYEYTWTSASGNNSDIRMYADALTVSVP